MPNIKYILLILLIAIISINCKKELNVYPTTSDVDGNVITDSASARVVLNGVYYRLANTGVDAAGNPTILWSYDWEIFTSELAGTVLNPALLDVIYTFTYTYQSTEVTSFWTYGYNLINAANGYIKNLNSSNISPSSKAPLLAEGKFLRAFGNEMMLLLFGQYSDTTSQYGIILRNEFVTTSTLTEARNSVKECYDSILSDIDYAIDNLPETNTATYYANRACAKLLKARILINRGTPDDIANVISITNDIIQNETSFSLEDSLKDIFLTNGFSSKEVLLGLQPYATQNYKFQRYQDFGYYGVTDSMIDRLQGDPRSNWYYKYDEESTLIGSIYGGINEITKYYSGDVVNFAKTTNSELCYAFRLSEAYLLGAEAYCTQGTNLSEAKNLLMEVQKRSGISDFSELNAISNAADLKEKVVREEMANFMCENGSDWFALRRLPLATIQKINPQIPDANHLIFPIPYSEITANNKIVQNPGF